MKPVENIKFHINKYPEVLSVINRLAVLEERRPHDVAKRLILKGGKALIEKLELAKKSTPQSAEAC